MSGSIEPCWLELQELKVIHREVIAASGGLSGISNQGMISSALAAVQAFWHYAPETPSMLELGARLAYGLAKNHGFVDGNKRTAFIATYTFLAINGIVIKASQRSVVQAMEALASSTDGPGQTQARFAAWLSTVSTSTIQKRL